MNIMYTSSYVKKIERVPRKDHFKIVKNNVFSVLHLKLNAYARHFNIISSWSKYHLIDNLDFYHSHRHTGLFNHLFL